LLPKFVSPPNEVGFSLFSRFQNRALCPLGPGDDQLPPPFASQKTPLGAQTPTVFLEDRIESNGFPPMVFFVFLWGRGPGPPLFFLRPVRAPPAPFMSRGFFFSPCFFPPLFPPFARPVPPPPLRGPVICFLRWGWVLPFFFSPPAGPRKVFACPRPNPK